MKKAKLKSSGDDTGRKNIKTWLGWSLGGPPSKLIENESIFNKPRDLAKIMDNYFQTSIKCGKREGASQAQLVISYFLQAHLPYLSRMHFWQNPSYIPLASKYDKSPSKNPHFRFKIVQLKQTYFLLREKFGYYMLRKLGRRKN